MNQWIAAARKIFVGSLLIVSGAPIVTVARCLILIGPGLILVAQRLLALGKRMSIIGHRVSADQPRTPAGRARLDDLIHTNRPIQPTGSRPFGLLTRV